MLIGINLNILLKRCDWFGVVIIIFPPICSCSFALRRYTNGYEVCSRTSEDINKSNFFSTKRTLSASPTTNLQLFAPLFLATSLAKSMTTLEKSSPVKLTFLFFGVSKLRVNISVPSPHPKSITSIVFFSRKSF